MKVKIKKLNKHAAIPFKFTETDGAYDVVATSHQRKGANHIYGLGIATEIPEGYRLRMVPRSSFTKLDAVLPNVPTLIDSDYRGEIRVVYKSLWYYSLIGRMLGLHKKKPYNVGDRIAQCYIECMIDIEWEETKQLSRTKRGIAGFGSTGK